jgi:hypothetical protein
MAGAAYMLPGLAIHEFCKLPHPGRCGRLSFFEELSVP